MKIFKKVLSAVLIAVVVLSLSLCASFSALAADYGTEAEGLVIHSSKIACTVAEGTKGLPNGDFEKGLMYWGRFNTADRGDSCVTDIATIMTEDNGNKFLKLTDGEANWDGLYSTSFTDSRVSIDESTLTFLENCRGDETHQVVLMQQLMNKDKTTRSEIRLAQEAHTFLLGTGADGWNTAYLSPNNQKNVTVDPTKRDPKFDDPTIYLNFFVQLTSDPTAVIEFDNIQLVRKSGQYIKDLDGNTLWDLSNLPMDPDAMEDDPFDDYLEDTTNYTLEPEDTSDDSADEDAGFLTEKLLWIIIGAGAIVVIAAAVVVVIIIKKKKALPKNDQALAEEKNETEETTEAEE